MGKIMYGALLILSVGIIGIFCTKCPIGITEDAFYLGKVIVCTGLFCTGSLLLSDGLDKMTSR